MVDERECRNCAYWAPYKLYGICENVHSLEWAQGTDPADMCDEWAPDCYEGMSGYLVKLHNTVAHALKGEDWSAVRVGLTISSEFLAANALAHVEFKPSEQPPPPPKPPGQIAHTSRPSASLMQWLMGEKPEPKWAFWLGGE